MGRQAFPLCHPIFMAKMENLAEQEAISGATEDIAEFTEEDSV